jgi:hypothetical protein
MAPDAPDSGPEVVHNNANTAQHTTKMAPGSLGNKIMMVSSVAPQKGSKFAGDRKSSTPSPGIYKLSTVSVPFTGGQAQPHTHTLGHSNTQTIRHSDTDTDTQAHAHRRASPAPKTFSSARVLRLPQSTVVVVETGPTPAHCLAFIAFMAFMALTPFGNFSSTSVRKEPHQVSETVPRFLFALSLVSTQS